MKTWIQVPAKEIQAGEILCFDKKVAEVRGVTGAWGHHGARVTIDCKANRTLVLSPHELVEVYR